MTSTLSIIAAVAQNGVIGAGGGMPWRLSTDMRRFRDITTGKPVIMGRKTWQGLKGPLKDRTNIVVTRDPALHAEGALVAPSLPAAVAAARQAAGGEIIIMGGGEIYAAALPLADRLYITHVHAAPPGDTLFPTIDPAEWQPVSRQAVPAGDKDSAASDFVVYERRAARR